MNQENFCIVTRFGGCLFSMSLLFCVSTLTFSVTVTILSVTVTDHCAIIDDDNDDDDDVYGVVIVVKSVVKV